MEKCQDLTHLMWRQVGKLQKFKGFFFFPLFLVRVLLYSQAGFKLIILLPRLPECWITGVNYYTWQIFLYFHYVLCLPNTDCLMDMHCG